MEENAEKRGYLLEDFHLFHLRDARGTNVDYHYHDFYKIVMLLSGSGSYTVESRRYALKAGDIVLVGNLKVHKPEFETGVFYERFVLYISPDFIRNHEREDGMLSRCFSGQDGHVLRPEDEQRRKLFSLVFQLETEMASERFGREMYSRCLLLQLLLECNREMIKNRMDLPAPQQTKDSKILDILRYLDENTAEDISIDDIAKKFYMSKYHMMRRFREETGTSIHAYLSDRRLLFARDLMQQGLSSTEACYECGFKSYSSFARAYQKYFGVTPTGRTSIPLPDEAEFE